MVQEPSPTMLPPVKIIEVGDVVVSVPPPHAVAKAEVTERPVASMSLKLTPVSVVAVFGFMIVNVRVVVELTGIGDGEKLSLIVGGATTVRLGVLLPVPAVAVA